MLEERKKETTPFFLLLSYQAVHAPLQVPDFYKRRCRAFFDPRRQLYCGRCRGRGLFTGFRRHAGRA